MLGRTQLQDLFAEILAVEEPVHRRNRVVDVTFLDVVGPDQTAVRRSNSPTALSRPSNWSAKSVTMKPFIVQLRTVMVDGSVGP